jgi:hypothetical protein
MQYLGHKSLETTQLYLKNLILENTHIANLNKEEEKNEEKKEEIITMGKRKRKIKVKSAEEQLIIREKKVLTELNNI